MTERLNFHAIIGPNGMCMCGVKADGTVVTCGALLDEYVASLLRASASALPEKEQPVMCVCGHEQDAHGNDGVGHCGERPCRAGACKKFKPVPSSALSPEPPDTEQP